MHLHPELHLPSALKATALAMTLLAAPGARAEDDKPSRWTFGGFGTVGLTHADTDQADFSSTILKAEGAGYSGAWSHVVDTRLGLQAGLTVNKQWSAVVQVVSEKNLDNKYTPTVEWANIKYQVTPDLSLRLGRIAVPMYLAAEYRKVGYAYTFARTPAEVYNAVPVTSSDGIDLNYRWQGAGFKHNTQLFYGRYQMPLLRDYRVSVRALTGLSYTAERGPLTLRISGLTARLSTNIGYPLWNGLRQFGAAGNALADQYEVVNKRTSALSIGASYDPGNWYVMAEVGDMNGRSMLARTESAYVSAGLRRGAFTPYVTVATIDSPDPIHVDGLPTAGLPPRAAAGAAALNAYLATIPLQTSYSAGVRWDFMSNMALKLQYDRVSPRGGSRGTLINQQPGFRSDQSVNAVSAVLDFVF